MPLPFPAATVVFRTAGVHNSFRAVVGALAHLHSELVLLLGTDSLARTPDSPTSTQAILTLLVARLVGQLHACYM